MSGHTARPGAPRDERRRARREAEVAAMIDYLRGALAVGGGREERFHAIFLDDRNAYLGDGGFGHGCGPALSLRMRDLFGGALHVGARSILVAHNHPSGDCRPSHRDIEATRRLRAVGAALDIELLDHLVITREAVFSMRAGGLF